MNGADRTVLGSIARFGLACLEPAYRVVVVGRNAVFNTGLRQTRRLGRPTISVGNLTTGGTGKTPMVIDLAQRLVALGAHPAVLLRGYRGGGSGIGSDEAMLLREALGSAVPVEADADRSAGAKRVLQAHPGTDVFLLDDGFQHRQVYRDIDLVLIDVTQPFGFGRVLPRGMLREPVKNLRRASAVILTRADQVQPDRLAGLDRQVKQITSRAPIAHVAYTWGGYCDAQGVAHPREVLGNKRVLGVCGVGNPDAFEARLRAEVGQMVEMRVLGDHYQYRRDQIEGWGQDAQRAGLDAIVTTDKDWVKWRGLLDGATLPIPIYRPRLCVAFIDNGQRALDALLNGVLEKKVSTSPAP